ncbi:MAG: class I SAM-dependent methyltransferase, partial [Mycetocola sp.]
PFPEGEWDLVTASFLQSPVALDRRDILRRAAAAVATGGQLVIITHAAPPSWAPEHAHGGSGMLTAAQNLAELDLPADDWTVGVAEQWTRTVAAPDGSDGHLVDGVLVLRRNR